MRTNEELSFTVTVNGNIEMRCVVDTGAGSSYLMLPDKLDYGLKLQACRWTVRLADGTRRTMTELVQASLTVGGRYHNVQLVVVRIADATEGYLLMGRNLIREFQVYIAPTGDLFVGGWDERDQIRALEDVLQSNEGIEELINNQLPRQEALFPLADEDRVTVPIEDNDKSAVLQCLIDLTKKGWVTVRHTPMVDIRLRELAPEDRKDVPNQQYTFELSLRGCRGARPDIRNYSEGAIRRLNTKELSEYKVLIQQYLNYGWWTEGTLEDCCAKSVTPAACVFPVIREGRDMRLVCDFREANRDFVSSVDGELLWHSLAAIRMKGLNQLLIADAKSAFYRVRLVSPQEVWLATGTGHFLCKRMAFGLSFGPSGLRESLGLLFGLWKKSLTEEAMAGMFVDDMFLCSAGEWERPFGIFAEFLQMCGFEVPKKKFQLITEGSQPGTLFGANISITKDAMKVSCGREHRLKQCRRLLERGKFTKADVFGAAGLLSYDASRMHAEERLASDVLRSLIGSAFSTVSWKKQLQLDELSELDAKIFSTITRWIMQLCEQPVCEHVSPLSTGQRIDLLRLESDASQYGGAFRLYIGDVELVQDAYAWKKAEWNYHSNRLELISAFRAIHAMTRFLEKYCELNRGRVHISQISIGIDNEPSVAWINKGMKPTTKGKQYEFRQMCRVHDGIREELNVLKRMADSVVVFHLPGMFNTADPLSRLLDRDHLGKLLRERHVRGSEPVCAIREQQKPPTPFIEVLASCSFSFPILLANLAKTRGLLNRRLSQSTDAWDEENIQSFARACQVHMKDDNTYLREDGIFYHVITNYNGETLKRYVIPRLESVQQRIVRHFHELDGHRGKKHDFSRLIAHDTFYLESAYKAVSTNVSRCLICMRKNAIIDRRVTAATIPRDVSLPPFSRIAIDYVFMAGDSVLSAVCLDTLYLFLVRTEGTTAESSAQAVQRLANRFCVEIRLIHCDNDKRFGKRFQNLLRAEGHLQLAVTNTAPYSSQQNPVERLHREMWSILRTRRLGHLVAEHVITDELLEGVSAIINRRPLGVSTDGPRWIVVTPARLAFGSAYNQTGSELHGIRTFYYEECFLQFRRRQLPSKGQRRAPLRVGMVVLCYDPTAGKAELSFFAARVVAMEPGNRVQVRGPTGDLRKVTANTVVPLADYFQVDHSPDSLEGHVDDR